jgi:glycosyltransferase involved in cell wall biosynthesis
MKSHKLRILIIAHELSPTQGSECAEGWNIVTRLAKHHNVTVLYASGSQAKHNSYVDAVYKYIGANGIINGLTFNNVDQPRPTKFISYANKSFRKLGPIGLPVLYYLGYKYWQKAAFAKAKELHKKESFDVVHQLTQIAFREPGYCWKLGIPFFWGPTGGTTTLPKSFYKLLSKKSRILESIRTFSNYYQFNFIPRIIKANKAASVIYAFSNEDASVLKKRASGEIKLMLDAGTTNHAALFNTAKNNASIVKGIWCGQLSERKSATILLRALSLSALTREKIKFQIVGSGPLERVLHEQAIALGLNNIEWIKNVDRDSVFKLMSEADFFVHTSLREATSNVSPEALSTGLPVICHDANGMSVAINESCGIKIPLVSPEISINGFHAAIEKLISDKELLTELRIGANKRSLEISWDIMAETMANDYTAVVNKNTKKPVN